MCPDGPAAGGCLGMFAEVRDDTRRVFASGAAMEPDATHAFDVAHGAAT